jgi:glyoxylate reductase
MKKSVLVTNKLFEEVLNPLLNRFEVEVFQQDEPMPRDLFKERVEGKTGLIAMAVDRVDQEIFDIAKSLTVVSTVSVGVDHIDIETATKRGIMIANTPGVLTETTADLAFALMMTVARRIGEAERYTRSGKWKIPIYRRLLGTDVHRKTLGIIGFGRIGRAVAKRAGGFGMKVLYYDIARADKAVESDLNAHLMPLHELLATADFVSLHVPLDKSTEKLIDQRRLALMKRTAFLINTSRGKVIDEIALIKALKHKEIAGAALDVFQREPYLPRELIEMENVVLTPHIGSASYETRKKMAELAVENCFLALEGRRPRYLLNPEVWKEKGDKIS